MQGLGRHLLLDLFECRPDVLDNVEAVKRVLIEAARRAEATIVTTTFHKFTPAGISGVVVIMESHLTIHTWPEHGYAAVDIFSCGRLKPEAAVRYLVRSLAAKRVSIVELRRGVSMEVPETALSEAAAIAD